MRVFLSTGLAEPRTLLKHLMASAAPNLQDLELIQMVILGDAVGDVGQGQVIAEGRYLRFPDAPWADVAFVVDEEYQGKGLATHIFLLLIRVAKERGVKGFTADVLSSNKSMMKVFEKAPRMVEAKLEGGIYHLAIPFEKGAERKKRERGGGRFWGRK
jgi:GNAT superfamily N-acetyltransferase